MELGWRFHSYILPSKLTFAYSDCTKVTPIKKWCDWYTWLYYANFMYHCGYSLVGWRFSWYILRNADDLHVVKLSLICGSMASASLCDYAVHGTQLANDVIVVYGMTETGTLTTSHKTDPLAPQYPGSVGFAAPSNMLKVCYMYSYILRLSKQNCVCFAH